MENFLLQDPDLSLWIKFDLAKDVDSVKDS